MTSIKYGYSPGGSCSSPPTNLGNLTYTGACPEQSRGDADSRISGAGGSLAAVNLPPVASNNLYLATNDLSFWNGSAASHDNRGNVIVDPTNNLIYQWDERNQLSAASSSYSFFYDALGRRETFDDLGVVWSYLYDSLMAVQANSNTRISQSFSRPLAVKC